MQKRSSRLTGGTERMEPTQPRLSCIFVSRSFRRLIRFVAITSSGSGLASAPDDGRGVDRAADDTEPVPSDGLDRGLNASLRELPSKASDSCVHPLRVPKPVPSFRLGQLGERASSTGLLAEPRQDGKLALGDGKFALPQEHPMLREVDAEVPNRRGRVRLGRGSIPRVSWRDERVHGLEAREQDHDYVRREQRIDAVLAFRRLPDEDDRTRRIGQVIRGPLFARSCPVHVEMVTGRVERVESAEQASPIRPTFPWALDMGRISDHDPSMKCRHTAGVLSLNRR